MNKSKGAAAKVRVQVKREERARRLCQGAKGTATMKIDLTEQVLIGLARETGVETLKELQVFLGVALKTKMKEAGSPLDMKIDVKIWKHEK